MPTNFVVKIVFTKNLAGIGEVGEEKNVKPGYARNYLLPQGLAVLSGSSQAKSLILSRRGAKKRIAKLAKEVLNIETVTVEFKVKAKDSESSYQGVGATKIEKEIEKKYGPKVKVKLKKAIRKLGEHKLKAKASGTKKEIEVIVRIVMK